MQYAIRRGGEFRRAACVISVLFAAACLCSGCTAPEHRKDSSIAQSSSSTAPVPHRTADQTVKDFLCWYNDNYGTLNRIPLVTNSPPAGDSTKYYAVNFEGTERWLTVFQESGFVSGAFVSHWRNYFRNAEKAFRNDPVSDGPPAGFEHDFIYNSQEDLPPNADIRDAVVVQDSTTGDPFVIVLNIPNFGAVTKMLVKSKQGIWLLAQ